MKGIDVTGKKGLIVGIANDKSIARGCADVLHAGGAELAITYLNEKAKPHVQPIADAVNAALFLPLDVTDDAQFAAVFDAIGERWGKLDFLIHSIAYAPLEDLHGRVTDTSRDGFLQAMNISCHSFIRMARAAEPLMQGGGSLLTMSYYGARQVVPNYGVMGPVKAALESSVEYMAAELGAKNIRVNAISPGPVATRAASGIAGFDDLLEQAARKSPLHRIITPEDVGHLAAFLVSDLSGNVTGGVHFVDAGYEVMD
jgi:enoyl-[acyl-carrier protein] reductase I